MDDVQFEHHYRATKDLQIKLKADRREHIDGSHLYGSQSHAGDDFNQKAGHVLEVAEGHKVRLTEAEAAPYLKSGDLVPAP